MVTTAARTGIMGGRMPQLDVAPSILAADFGRLREQVEEVRAAGALDPLPPSWARDLAWS